MSFHLDTMATEYVVDMPNTSERMTVAESPTTITGFLPIESETYPQQYPLRKRPRVNALATYPA